MGAALVIDALFGTCPEGKVKSGRLCYPPCPSGFQGVGPVCWERCPPNTTNSGVDCTKHSFSDPRRAPICGPDEVEDAGLCYTPCQAGYKGVADLCWPECPDGFKDTGATCLRPTYGRGGGWLLTERSRCERQAREARYKSVGTCDKCEALLYPTCADGYWHTTCNFCAGECPSQSFNQTDVDCEKVPYSRGVGTIPKSCPEGYLYRDDLSACYKECPEGFKYGGGRCYTECGEDWQGGETLATCTKKTIDRGAGTPLRIDYFWVWVAALFILGVIVLFIVLAVAKTGSQIIAQNPELLA